MPKIVVLDQPDIVAGIAREAGEVATVPDGYTNVRRVIRDLADVSEDNARGIRRHLIRKILEIAPGDDHLIIIAFLAEYPGDAKPLLDLLPRLNDQAYTRLIRAMDKTPDVAHRMINKPQMLQVRSGRDAGKQKD